MVAPLFRPQDEPSKRDGFHPDEYMHLEEPGGTFEKASYFQSNHAFVIKLEMVLPFKKFIWANRLTRASYLKHMRKLDLRPAEWFDTYDLRRGWCDPAYQKTELPRDICMNCPPLARYPIPSKRVALATLQDSDNVPRRDGQWKIDSYRPGQDSYQ